MAPLYFHFGHHWWFIEIMTTLADASDTVAVYFLAFLFAGILAYYRNVIFQAFTKSLYKNYTTFQNLLPIYNHFSFFFVNFVKLTSSLTNQFSNTLKKLKK